MKTKYWKLYVVVGVFAGLGLTLIPGANPILFAAGFIGLFNCAFCLAFGMRLRKLSKKGILND